MMTDQNLTTTEESTTPAPTKAPRKRTASNLKETLKKALKANGKAKVVAKKAAKKATKEADANVCTVAAIARELGMSEKVARAKCRRNRDFFKKLPRLTDAPGVWTFKASAKPKIVEFLQARSAQ